jgi:hypothetical protein
VFNRLQAARAAGATVTAYVDPTDPTSAVLHRELHVDLVFDALLVLAIGGFALGILATGIKGAREARELAANRARHPDKPWLWRRDWERGFVKDDSFVSTQWVAALVSTQSVAPFVSISRQIRALKFDGTVFKLARVPVAPGARLEGELRVPWAIDAADGVHLIVRCAQIGMQGTGTHRRQTTTTLWESTTVSPASSWRRCDTETSVPVAVDIPADQPASSVPDGGVTGVVWSLEARAEVPGVNLASVFVLPVFRDPASSSTSSSAAG